jgi:hypothetical protein
LAPIQVGRREVQTLFSLDFLRLHVFFVGSVISRADVLLEELASRC